MKVFEFRFLIRKRGSKTNGDWSEVFTRHGRTKHDAFESLDKVFDDWERQGIETIGHPVVKVSDEAVFERFEPFKFVDLEG